MSEYLTAILKRKLENINGNTGIDAETQRNALKEELQFYVLNFIYHHSEYSKWVMYGGSSLRIIHDLSRMSVDLDFEISSEISEKFLEKLKKEIEEHFFNVYGVGADFMVVKIVNGRGLLLKFIIGEDLSFGHPSKQVHVKVDLNHFISPKVVLERRPINHDQLSFVIVAYNMSTLMASKLAAIFLRGTRNIGDAIYEEKGRDIYDLLWYMTKKIIPDFDYLVAKGVDVKDMRALFDKLTLQINKVSDKNLKQDLEPLFTNKIFIANWLENWRESYLRLLDDYKINIIANLRKIEISENIRTDNSSFTYVYNTEKGEIARITYQITYEWIMFEKLLGIKIDVNVLNLVKPKPKKELIEQIKQLLTIFYQKSESYLKKTNRVMLGNSITTKLIRMTVDNLNQKEEILLNKSTLLSCELDDLLK